MDLKKAMKVLDAYAVNKKQLQEKEKAFKAATKKLKVEVAAAEKALLAYCKEQNIKVVVSKRNMVEVQARKSTSISLKKLFAYSLGKLRDMRVFLACVRPQVSTVKKLYNQQTLVDKGILKVVDNDYHHLKVVPTTWEE